MKLLTIAALSCFIGCLGAQTSQTETTTTRGVDMNGTLVDQNCVTTHTKQTDTNSSGNTTTTTETNRYVTECPVTTSTTSFGMVTPEGKLMRFDDASNTRVIEVAKSNKAWRKYMEGKKPVRVHVIAEPNGDTLIVKEIR